MTSVPPTQPPAAPETDVSRRRAIRVLDCNAADLHSEVKLTAAEEDAIENAWVAAPKDGPAASRDPMYAAVERIVAERVRVVEGERDAAAMSQAVAAVTPCACSAQRARAEAAEAAHEALRKGIEALADEWEQDADGLDLGRDGFDGVVNLTHRGTLLDVIDDLRALLAGGAS